MDNAPTKITQLWTGVCKKLTPWAKESSKRRGTRHDCYCVIVFCKVCLKTRFAMIAIQSCFSYDQATYKHAQKVVSQFWHRFCPMQGCTEVPSWTKKNQCCIIACRISSLICKHVWCELIALDSWTHPLLKMADIFFARASIPTLLYWKFTIPYTSFVCCLV